jgi:hypothetical protein
MMRRSNHISLLSLFLSLLFLFGTVFTSAVPSRRDIHARDDARSIERNSPTSLFRRDDLTPALPDLDTCKQHFTVGKDKGVFYSSDVIKSAIAYANANGKS